MAATFKAGVAGWDYKNWNGTVYPERPGRGFDKLEYLSLYLPLFEINRTYYRAASAAEARSWVERVAPRPGVVFTAKIPEQFVAPGKSWTREDVAHAREGLDVLNEAGRLGAAVLQFAYSFKRIRQDAHHRRGRAEAGSSRPPPRSRAFRSSSSSGTTAGTLPRSWPSCASERSAGSTWTSRTSRRIRSASGRTPPPPPATSGCTGATTRRGCASSAAARRRPRRTSRSGRRRRPSSESAEEDQKNARFDYLYPRLRAGGHRPDGAGDRRGSPRCARSTWSTTTTTSARRPTNALMLESMLTDEDVPAPPDLFEHYPEALKGFAHPVPAEGLREPP